MHRIGFHISVAQGFLKVFDDAKTLGANCCQIFTHSPRSWAFNVVSEDIGKLFKIAYEKNNIKPIVVHEMCIRDRAETGTMMKFEKGPIMDVHSIGGVPGNKTALLLSLIHI